MTALTEEQYQAKIRELEKEVKKLNLIIQKDSKTKYGLRWIDVPEAFEKESENKIPILEEVKDKAIKNDDGKPTHILIEGDNYHALKCLNYTHKGKIDVIYIDPPYNTGSDGFTYKDKRFLNQYPDGTTIPKEHPLRHSTWLSFMSKRLELAKNLLSEKGVIFISIDDNEQANLKLLCDEIFGEGNFEGQLILKTATDNNPSQINIEHEYMLCYCLSKYKQTNWERQSQGAKLIINEYQVLKKKYSDIEKIQTELRIWIKQNKTNLSQVAHYNNVDEKGVYSSSSNSSNPHPGGYMYDILHPITKRACPKPQNGWRWPKSTFEAYDKKGEIEWGKDETTQPHVKKRIETSTEYLRSLIYEDNRGTTKELSNIFEGVKVFDNPKPHNVLSRIFDFVTSPSSIILDFFAGSGTTLHATMKLNSEDGGKRQCILVQQNEKDNNICQNITYERNRRVMQGYINPKGEAVSGLGNSLKYYRTAFVGENEAEYATDKDKIALSKKAGCLLSMAENTLEEYVSTDRYQIFGDDKNLFTGIYFSANADKVHEFAAKLEQLRNMKERNSISAYFFSSGDGSEFADEFESLRNIKIKSIPEPILEIYRRLN